MQTSAEIRWFWRDEPPPGLEDWFLEAWGAAGSATPCAPRTDRYLLGPGQVELGIKSRGGTAETEIKGLVHRCRRRLAVGPFEGRVEVWNKWTLLALQLDEHAVLDVEKRRWLRSFDASGAVATTGATRDDAAVGGAAGDAACHVELARLTLPVRERWWTFALEAHGSADRAERILQAVAATLAEREPPPLGRVVPCSYPVWLNRIRRGR